MTDAIKLRNSCWRNTLAGCVRFNVLLKQAKISKALRMASKCESALKNSRRYYQFKLLL